MRHYICFSNLSQPEVNRFLLSFFSLIECPAIRCYNLIEARYEELRVWGIDEVLDVGRRGMIYTKDWVGSEPGFSIVAAYYADAFSNVHSHEKRYE